MKKLSIIIVNYNVKEFVSNCLKSIFESKFESDYEVIVIDNASKDGSVEMILKKFPQVRLIPNKANYGFAKACNQGIAIAQGEYVFLINPDSEVESFTFDRIVGYMDSHPEVGIGGCFLYYPDGKIQSSFYKFTSLTNHLGRTLLLYSFLPKNYLTAPFFWDYFGPGESIERVCGGAMVVRRMALEEVGPFDESFFLYYEDEDLCYRMRQKRWKIAPIPGTKIIHYHNQSGKENTRQAIFSAYQSQFRFFRKYHSLPRVIIFRVIQFISALIRTAYWFFRLLVSANPEEIKQKFIAYLSILFCDFNYNKSLIP
jgi:GT2 family glycosyltransferase